MKDKEQELPPLEQGLLAAMKAVDNQVAREMQRSPQQLEQHGVQKWEPYSKRVEIISAFALSRLGDEDVTLDSVLVLAQAMAKTLQLVVQDLGRSGLGKVRSAYCLAVAESITYSAKSIESELSTATPMS